MYKVRQVFQLQSKALKPLFQNSWKSTVFQNHSSSLVPLTYYLSSRSRSSVAYYQNLKDRGYYETLEKPTLRFWVIWGMTVFGGGKLLHYYGQKNAKKEIKINEEKEKITPKLMASKIPPSMQNFNFEAKHENQREIKPMSHLEDKELIYEFIPIDKKRQLRPIRGNRAAFSIFTEAYQKVADGVVCVMAQGPKIRYI